MAEQVQRSNNQLFPTGIGTNLSHEFEVTDRPVTLKAFNLEEGVELIIEMGATFACDKIWGPYRPNCCLVKITHERNAILLGVSGLYRVFIHDPEELGFDELVLIQHVVDSHHPVPDFCGCEETIPACDCRTFPPHLGNDDTTVIFHAPETV